MYALSPKTPPEDVQNDDRTAIDKLRTNLRLEDRACVSLLTTGSPSPTSSNFLLRTSPPSPLSIAQESVGPSSTTLVRKLPLAYRRLRKTSIIETKSRMPCEGHAIVASDVRSTIRSSTFDHVCEILSARLAAITQLSSTEKRNESLLDRGHETFLCHHQTLSTSGLLPAITLAVSTTSISDMTNVDRTIRKSRNRLSNSTTSSGATFMTERIRSRKRSTEADAWDEEEVDKPKLPGGPKLKSLLRGKKASSNTVGDVTSMSRPDTVPSVPSLPTTYESGKLQESPLKMSFNTSTSTLDKVSQARERSTRPWRHTKGNSFAEEKQPPPSLQSIDRVNTDTPRLQQVFKSRKSKNRPGTAPVSSEIQAVPFGRRPGTAQQIDHRLRPSSNAGSPSSDLLSGLATRRNIVVEQKGQARVPDLRSTASNSFSPLLQPLEENMLRHRPTMESYAAQTTPLRSNNLIQLSLIDSGGLLSAHAKRASQNAKVLEMKSAMHILQAALDEDEEGDCSHAGDEKSRTPSMASNSPLSIRTSSISETSTPLTPYSHLSSASLHNAAMSGLHSWSGKETIDSVAAKRESERMSVSGLHPRPSTSQSSLLKTPSGEKNGQVPKDRSSRVESGHASSTVESRFSTTNSNRSSFDIDRASGRHSNGLKVLDNRQRDSFGNRILRSPDHSLSNEEDSQRPRLEEVREIVQDEEILQTSAESYASTSSFTFDEAEMGSIQSARKLDIKTVKTDVRPQSAPSECGSTTSVPPSKSNVSSSHQDTLAYTLNGMPHKSRSEDAHMRNAGIMRKIGEERMDSSDRMRTQRIDSSTHTVRFVSSGLQDDLNVEIDWRAVEPGCTLSGSIQLSSLEVERIARAWYRSRRDSHSSYSCKSRADSREGEHILCSLDHRERMRLDEEILAQRQEEIIASFKNRSPSAPGISSLSVDGHEAQDASSQQEHGTMVSRQVVQPRALLLTASLDRHANSAPTGLQARRRQPTLQRLRIEDHHSTPIDATSDHRSIERRKISPRLLPPFGRLSSLYVRTPEVQKPHVGTEFALQPRQRQAPLNGFSDPASDPSSRMRGGTLQSGQRTFLTAATHMPKRLDVRTQ